ncbi:type IV pilus twitching motility protein PilT [Desulfuromonas acetoxidans]|uniref:Twitching motility protein n=1 Tax=Desulfuromonas acetoxidans (strain DSM 684 / 11070) TaxID=281689 RepID=Q1K4H4_DESA6|nr:PilT/PilU family type 4a pilus ATPase [Desulfuromonas acetoxidans]EAT17129.1 twitching motility protein [Desulfuromonas acetoxidans DSM 684]MBF0647035.1 PilT/PilU family type 4a pilus ATPase [Desulfuromonas acetoxidans]NVD24284.1 PilT/PilU family type 4a pilus ATPase [Desulfuromonas acetoxidans]NVE14943.1 PilT/PilU family type 4a pilus ATPase [Desulfuromonas acetoxidans]
MAQIDRLFDIMLDRGASDLHLLQGQPPKIREHGRMVAIDGEAPINEEQMIGYLKEICVPERWTEFLANKDLDFAYEKDEKARFRANYYGQLHGMGAVFRVIPTKILTMEELHLPEVLKSFAALRSGLVLVTGPTGSGKSTTLAAIIDYINDNYSRYILTIEEPIEFVHPNKRSVFCQREVGSDVHSFGDGLHTASRQDCDVILVGEMRDYETISLALSAASMGTLVFGTLHTNSAVKTIDRIIDVFPSDQQGMARTMLADSLRGICAQLLLKKEGGGRIAANEILIGTTGLAASIRENNIGNIRNIIQGGKSLGMQMMDDVLASYLKDELISPDEAYLKAQDKNRFKPKDEG